MSNLEQSLLKFGEELVDEMKAVLLSNNKQASGELIDSLRSYTEEDEEGTFLYLKMAGYGKWVDKGRKPGKRPPREPIRQWIKQKGIRGRNKKGRFIKDDNLAFLIQRKIGIRGIEPTPFLHLFYDKQMEINDLVEESSMEDVEERLDEYIKKLNAQ